MEKIFNDIHVVILEEIALDEERCLLYKTCSACISAIEITVSNKLVTHVSILISVLEQQIIQLETVDISELLERHKKVLDWEYVPPLNQVHQFMPAALQQTRGDHHGPGTEHYGFENVCNPPPLLKLVNGQFEAYRTS